MENDKGGHAHFELRCIGEILQVIGNSLTEDSPYPWIVWLGEQVERVEGELYQAMLEARGEGTGT